MVRIDHFREAKFEVKSAVGCQDYFYCFLEDQPNYLVPTRLLPGDFDQHGMDKLYVNPNASFSWQNDPYSSPSRPDKFLGDTATAWVWNPVNGISSPFWAGFEFQKVISHLCPGEPLPTSIPTSLCSILLAAGLLLRPDDCFQDQEKWNQTISRAAQEFQEYGYAAINGLIHPFHLGSLRRYYRRLLRTGGMILGDSGSPLRYVVHNESVARFFHREFQGTVSAIAGVPVKPSYVYVASYQSGAGLPIHTDRVQCEYTVSALIDHVPEPADQSPWPLYLQTAEAHVPIWQCLGDALLYRGRELPHYRKRLPDRMNATSIFFHYVDEDFNGSLD